ncbi:DUF6366 family protein [Bacillus sp. FJAT-47783]|uniref:DUF6366 family protein n=1 Tax=Bacillus sp. FJAT-47783 TaxID=2922712 RepID=UPI001FAB68ED|nr:DUF6366 family protein [Bacillus sp. FJAT-47783]
MKGENKNPERKRERVRQKEIKRNPTGNINDAFNRASIGSLVDLIGSIGWKGTGILIIVLIVGLIILSLSFN